jgi:hypothetical protein
VYDTVGDKDNNLQSVILAKAEMHHSLAMILQRVNGFPLETCGNDRDETCVYDTVGDKCNNLQSVILAKARNHSSLAKTLQWVDGFPLETCGNDRDETCGDAKTKHAVMPRRSMR